MERPVGSLARNLSSGETGTAFPIFRDAHVHLGLSSYDNLVDRGIGGVVDLGWSHEVRDMAAQAPFAVAYAGCFLTAVDGYPSRRAWAPPGSVRVVTGPDDGALAVDEQIRAGASLIKVTLNSAAGPVLDLATVTAIVAASPVPVVAHVEGPGGVATALDAGVQVLAHTPWTERVSDDLVSRAAASQRWISTLDIHGYGAPTPEQDIAVDNLRRFHDRGGDVLYGTDLGNGDLPAGLNARELSLLARAGLRNKALIHALTAPFAGLATGDRLTFVPGLPDHDLPAWLMQARVVRADELEEIA